MSRSLRRILFVVVGVIVLLVLAGLAVRLFVDVNRYKHQLEMAASDALGMDVRVGGRLGVGFFPRFHVTLEEGHILGAQGAAVVSTKKALLWIEPLPLLLRREFRLRGIELVEPRFSVERDPKGGFNAEGLKKAAALLGDPDGASVSFSDGSFLYTDRKSGGGFEATDFNLVVNSIPHAGARNPQLLKGFSVKARLACKEIRTKDLTVSSLEVLVDGNDGVFELEPITMNIFGGHAAVSIRADVSGPVPLYQVRGSLPHFRIEEFLKTLSPQKAAEGEMDFSASLSMQGKTRAQLVQTAAGEMALRSRHITLVGNDLDKALSRFESSQNFNLADVGAVFFAGPMGLAVSKGYSFAGLFQGSGGTSSIAPLVSHWRVDHGVAQAKDVAMATAKNRVALQGGLDFVNGRYADVTVAMVDAKGCAIVRQAIHGPFANPVVEKPRVLSSLAGPLIKLFRRTRRLFPAGPCKVFYTGSVAPPK